MRSLFIPTKHLVLGIDVQLTMENLEVGGEPSQSGGNSLPPDHGSAEDAERTLSMLVA